MKCIDCKAEGADCLTGERERVCADCLYDRVAEQRDALLAELERLKAEVESKVAQNVALMGQNGQLQLQLEARLDSPGTPKCKSLDCWICHGVPKNAGPR